MKFLKYLTILPLFFIAQSFALTPQEYLATCKNIPSDKNSACYSYFQGVLDSTNFHLCFANNTSDHEIYVIAVNGVTKFVKKHPGVDIYTPAYIIQKTLLKAFPCDQQPF